MLIPVRMITTVAVLFGSIAGARRVCAAGLIPRADFYEDLVTTMKSVFESERSITGLSGLRSGRVRAAAVASSRGMCQAPGAFQTKEHSTNRLTSLHNAFID